MKSFIFALFSFFFLFFPAFSYAQTDWVINNFQSNIVIKNDGKISVTEIIEVDFNTLEKHGIYRDLPITYQGEDGKLTYTAITVSSVLQDNQEAEYQVTKNDYTMRIRIGDPDRTISGSHSYVVSYSVAGVLRSFADHDELYWNITGNDWEAEIENALATISVPEEKIEKVICYEGFSGSKNECTTTQQSTKIVSFSNTRTLQPGEGITGVVGYTKGMVPILSVPPPKKITDDLFSPLSYGAFFLAILLGIGGVIFIWYKHGRDFWFRAPSRLDPHAKPEAKPWGAKVITTVEFTPPDNLRPAELGVLIDERADTLDVTATIIDLANRGFLTITEIDKKWLFGSKNYELHKKDVSPAKLLPYEKLLFERIFASGDVIKISALEKTFYDDLAEVKKELYKTVMEKKLFSEHPESKRNIYTLLSILVIFLGGLGIFLGFQFVSGPLAAFSLGIIFVGIFFVFMSRSMSRRTARGHELYQRTKGYLLFIGGAEKHRQQFFEKKNLFNETLPYAIVFGLTAKFAEAMKDIGVKTENPSWYSGRSAFTPVIFASNINSFSKALSTAIVSTPSSSGGFSGGSSGGGFGGGGGGSW